MKIERNKVKELYFLFIVDKLKITQTTQPIFYKVLKMGSKEIYDIKTINDYYIKKIITDYRSGIFK